MSYDIFIHEDDVSFEEFDHWVDIRAPLGNLWCRQYVGESGLDTWTTDTILGSKDIVPTGQFIDFWFRKRSDAVWFYMVWL